MIFRINKPSVGCYLQHRRNVGENDTFAEASLAENRIDAFRKKGSSSALFHRSVRPCKSLRLRSRDRKISSDKGKFFASPILVPCCRCTILTSNLLARWEPKLVFTPSWKTCLRMTIDDDYSKSCGILSMSSVTLDPFCVLLSKPVSRGISNSTNQSKPLLPALNNV
jgi:hypothetical protein